MNWDTQHPQRRHGLPARRDLRGVESQLQWESNSTLHRRSAPQDAGVLETILSGGIMTRERASKHAKGVFPPCCIMPGCGAPVETTEHRLWHCMEHEHLRTDEFKRLRERIHLLQPCEINCGLATVTFPQGFDIISIQQVMLRVELNARRRLDELKHGYQGDDPQEEAKYYQICTGVSGVHGARKRLKRPAAARGHRRAQRNVPQNQHPPDQLHFTENDQRVRCLRCTRAAMRSHSTNWAAFWEAECHDVQADGRNLRGINVAAGRARRDQNRANQLLLDFAADHGVRPEDFSWHGDTHAPFTCLKCHLSWPFMVARRDRLARQGSCLLRRCKGNTRENDEQIQALGRMRPHRSHSIARSPDGRVVVCRTCGLYVTAVPPSTAHRIFRECRPLVGRPWEGITYHDWNWYQPHV